MSSVIEQKQDGELFVTFIAVDGEIKIWHEAEWQVKPEYAALITHAPEMLKALELSSRNLSSLIYANHHSKVLMTEWKAVIDGVIALAKADVSGNSRSAS
jgi:hypothetical protein